MTVSGEKIVAFLPCRAGSERVPRKNTRPFGGDKHGLIDIKLQQLIGCTDIAEIVVSSNDPVVLATAERYQGAMRANIRIDHRPAHLCSSATSTDELIGYVPSIIPDGHVLWTHVTSPFFDEPEYEAAIAAYRAAVEKGTHRSLMSVTRLQGYLWTREGPINYDPSKERWPRTQTLPPLYEVNSAVFLISTALMRETGDRIAHPVQFHEVDKAKALDIDWEEDFQLASDIFEKRKSRA